jgi:hypothetical protein
MPIKPEKLKPQSLNLDIDPKYLKPQEYRYSLNGRIFNFDGRTTRYESVDGTSKAFDLPIGTFPIGYAEFDTLLFVFYTNLNSQNDPFQLVDIKCGIGVHIMGSTKKYVLRKQFFGYDDRETYPNDIIAPEGNFDILTELACFNFYGEHRIEAEIEPQYDNSISLYWTDNFNQVSYYNTALRYYENIDTNAIPQDFCNRFKLANSFLMPKIETPDDLSLDPNSNSSDDPQLFFIIGGDLKCGVYRVAVRYLEENLNPTNWSYLSKPIYIGEGGDRFGKWWKYDGGDSKQDSGKGFRIKITPVDINYKYLQLAVVQIPQSGFPTEFVISKKYLVNRSKYPKMYIEFRGTIDTELTEGIDELGIDLLSIDTAKSINILNNRLFIANVKPKQYSTEQYKKIINEWVRFSFEEQPANNDIGAIGKNIYNAYTDKPYYYVKQRYGQRAPFLNTDFNGGFPVPFYSDPFTGNPFFFKEVNSGIRNILLNGVFDQIPGTLSGYYNGKFINGWAHYRNEWMCFNRVGYFRDQEYNIGIQLVFKDGSKSPLFPITYQTGNQDIVLVKSPTGEMVDYPNRIDGKPINQRIKPLALKVTGLRQVYDLLKDQIQGISVYRSDRLNDVIIMQGLRQPAIKIDYNNSGLFGQVDIDDIDPPNWGEDQRLGGETLQGILNDCPLCDKVLDWNNDRRDWEYDESVGIHKNGIRIGENFSIWYQKFSPQPTPFSQATFFSSDLLFRNDSNDVISGNMEWSPAYCYMLSNYSLIEGRSAQGLRTFSPYYAVEINTSNGLNLTTTNPILVNTPYTVKNMWSGNKSVFFTPSRYGTSIKIENGYVKSYVYNSLTEFYPTRYIIENKDQNNYSNTNNKRYPITNFSVYQYYGQLEQLVCPTPDNPNADDDCFNMNLTRDKHAQFDIIMNSDGGGPNETDNERVYGSFFGNSESFKSESFDFNYYNNWNQRFNGALSLEPTIDGVANIVGYIGNIRKKVGVSQNNTYYLSEYFTEAELLDNNGAFYCYDGDCYIQQTWFTDIVQINGTDKNLNGDKYSDEQNSGNLIGFYSENTINSEFRFVPRFYNDTLSETEAKDRDYYPYRQNTTMRTGSERNPQIRLAYGAEDTIKNTIQSQQGIDRDFKEITRYPTRIYWSEPKIQGQRSDNYRNIRQLNFVDEDLSLGEVNKIISINSSLVSVQAQAINFRQVNMDVATKSESGFPIKLGTGEVLRGKPLTVTNQYGSQHQFSIVKSDKAIYGVDYRKQCIWMLLGQQFEIISESKNVSSFVRTYIDSNPNELFYQDKPLYYNYKFLLDCAEYPPGVEPPLTVDSYKAGIYSHYDPEYNEIYFTFYNKNRDINCFHLDVKTIVFNENINAFTGFMFDEGKLNPSMYMVVANKTLVYSPIVTYDDVNQIHYMNIKGSGLMFNQEYLTGLELVGNEDPSAIKKYGSAILHMNMFDRNGDYVYNIPTNTMSIIANNTYQKSVKIYLDQQIGAAGNVRRTEGKYKIFIPRSNVVLPAGEYFKEVLRDYWCGLTIYWTSSDAIKFSLDHIELFSLESNR